MRKKSRKQMWITFGVVSLFVVIGISFIIINRMQNVTSGQLNTNYQAGNNVQATLSGGYKLSGEAEQKLTTSDGKTDIEVNNGNASVPNYPTFNKVENIKLKRDEEFLVRYKIQNNNPDYTLVCNLDTNITDSSNILVEYSINNANWYENSEIIFGTKGKSIANNRVLYLYIRISVVENTINAKFDGSFNFILSTLE